MLSIEKIETVFEEIDVFDIEVEEDHSFVCKSAVLHNCHSCAGMSRKRWKTKEPHPVPPLHPSCRCVLIPVTELTDLGEDVSRPMANADFMQLAKEDYEKNHPGKKWDELAYATRKKYYYQAQKDFEKRTGKPAYSPAPGNMKFKDYFLQLDEKTRKSYLGPEQFKLWKKGNLDIEKFIPPFPDRGFTVREVKEMDKRSFYKGVPLKGLFSKRTKENSVPPPSFEIKGTRGIAAQTRLIIGSDKVDLTGITDEKMLNQMNHALYILKEKYPWLKFYGVKAVDNLPNSSPAALTSWGEIELNTDYINNLIKTYSRYPIENGKYINDKGAMYFGKEMETLIYHETGHEILRHKIGVIEKSFNGTKEQRHKLAVLKQMYRRAKRDGYALSVSNYAAQDKKEFFSEIFTANLLDKSKSPSYIINGIEEILK